jgi:hypothetical protein
MSKEHRLSWQCATVGGSTLSGSQSEVAAAETELSATYAGGLTNQALGLAWNHTNYQSLFIVADKDCVLRFNSTGSPILTINLKANAPYVWDRSPGYWADPLSADVTNIYLTTTAAVRLSIKVLA